MEKGARRMNWLSRSIFDVLQSTNRWVTPSEVYVLLRLAQLPRDFTKQAVKGSLWRMAKAGEIQGQGDGIYAAPGISR